jgi:amino acid adenylation domain-containing protein
MRLIVSDSRTYTVLTPAIAPGVELLDIDTISGQPAVPATPGRAEDPAYVMYTSASTGEPKAVMIAHQSVINLLQTMARRLKPGSSEGEPSAWLAITTVSFDISVLEIFLPLVYGFRLVLADEEEAHDGRLIAAALTRERITFLQATPAGWRLLLESGWEGDPRLTMLCGGEALPGELARALAPKGRALWNVYGPTETTIWSTAGLVTGRLDHRQSDRSAVSIGGPLGNTQVYILSTSGAVQPIGVPGELHIGGAGLAVGYYRDPATTAQRFVPNRIGGPSPRLYRTGDLARWLPDGTLEFLGRLDHQVKIRGFRIELGEIEATLLRAPGITDAVALVRAGAAGGTERRLIAYYTVRPDAPSATSDVDQIENLRRHLAAHLPEYMLPDALVRLDAMPRTPNGKVDRQSLPDAQAAAAAVRVEPTNAAEETIAALWRELLATSAFGIDDDFLGLGGNSLVAARLATRLGSAFNVHIPLRSLLEHRTVRRIAALVASLQWAADSARPAGASDQEIEITL